MTIDELRAAIHRRGDPYYHALLRHAAEFVGRRPSASVPVVRRWLEGHPAELRHCYRNAQFLCLAAVPDAQYHEGYRSSGNGSAVHHAWVVLGGDVIDPTAEEASRVLEGFGLAPADPSADTYLGIPVPTEFIRERLDRTGAWTPVAADYLTSLGTPVRHPAEYALLE